MTPFRGAGPAGQSRGFSAPARELPGELIKGLPAPLQGVNCDGTGNVVDLELSGVGLNGSIPAQLNQLS
eukprot:SM011308S23955  [mRNA]  locus=s11308:42:258:- [translate_table: standard]